MGENASSNYDQGGLRARAFVALKKEVIELARAPPQRIRLQRHADQSVPVFAPWAASVAQPEEFVIVAR